MQTTFFTQNDKITKIQMEVIFEYVGKPIIGGSKPERVISLAEIFKDPPCTNPQQIKAIFNSIWVSEQDIHDKDYEQYYMKLCIDGIYEGVPMEVNVVIKSPDEFDKFLKSINVYKLLGIEISDKMSITNDNK